MRRALSLLLLAVPFSLPAQNASPANAHPNELRAAEGRPLEPADPPRVEPSKEKRVVDWKFITVTALSIGAAVLDVEASQRAMRRCPTCQEASSWLLGSRPSRGRMYATILPFKVGETWAAYRLKKRGTRAWYAVPSIGGAVNLFGGLHSLGVQPSGAVAKTCPAGGAGCAPTP